MFSYRLDDILREAEKIGTFSPLDQKELLQLLEKSGKENGLEIDEIVALINGTQKEENKKLILDFSSQYKRPHNQEILLLPPLYFSSICENSCLYCDFSSEGIRLSYEEFLAEFNKLLDLGYRSIELVSSQDPDLFLKWDEYSFENQRYDIDKIANYFALARERLVEKGGGMLTSNIPPVDVNSFRKLRSVGLDCYLIWLETFNPYQYSKLHNKNGPKSNQSFRLDSFEFALEAGIEHLAGAFLKGLYDWRKEEVALYMFDRYLKKKNGRGFSIIGSPRLKGSFAESTLINPYKVTDEDYELNIALDRILFDGVLWLQTRESPSFNRYLIDKYGAGIILTIDCSTAPGGYSKPAKSKAQFPVFRQNLRKAVVNLEESNYKVYFDWNSEILLNMQRNTKGTEYNG